IGVSAALHLQKRGRAVVLVDRRGAAEETSYGNSGIIQREAIVPYAFPQEWRKILHYALNRSTESHLHWRALPSIAPILFQYWRHGTPQKVERTSRALKPLIERVIDEHMALMEQAGITGMVRRTGYVRGYRSARLLEEAIAEHGRWLADFGIAFEAKDAAGIRELEPHLEDVFVGGIFVPQPVSVNDPSAVGKAYAEIFTKGGGRFL